MHPPVFEFRTINEKDVADAINNLISSRASGPDGITSFMLKSARTELLPILTFLFNLSIQKKYVPTIWKDATVTPLFKSGSADDANNYRPISVLSSVVCSGSVAQNQARQKATLPTQFTRPAKSPGSYFVHAGEG